MLQNWNMQHRNIEELKSFLSIISSEQISTVREIKHKPKSHTDISEKKFQESTIASLQIINKSLILRGLHSLGS